MPWGWRLRFAEVAVTAPSGAEQPEVAIVELSKRTLPYGLTIRLEVQVDESSVRLNPDLPIASQYPESPTLLSPTP